MSNACAGADRATGAASAEFIYFCFQIIIALRKCASYTGQVPFFRAQPASLPHGGFSADFYRKPAEPGRLQFIEKNPRNENS
jgi:hypothetical protein